MEYFVVECYCTCIIGILRYFFIRQSLTTSKMRKFQTLKLSQFHKEKTCWTENWWSSGIMSNFWGKFFYVLGGKTFFLNFFKNILATALKSYIKWLLYIYIFFWKSLKKLKKLELSPLNSRYGVLHLLYSDGTSITMSVIIHLLSNNNFINTFYQNQKCSKF